jgi:hypothetical protein
MQPKKLNVLIATFPYAGNGGISSQADEVSDWLTMTMIKAHDDPRVEWIEKRKFSDTPIPMTRNKSVLTAREMGADVLVMVDSDMWPDMALQHGDPTAVPFWDTAFEYLYRHYDKGPVVIGAPYCGPPPNEAVYVFKWLNRESGHPNLDFQIEKYDREEARHMAGIQECAALPTGLIMYDMRVFALTEPQAKKDALRDRILFPYRDRSLSPEEAVELASRAIELSEHAEDSWFYYQWKDAYQTEKGSTEDVTATRDMAFHGYMKLGYNPLRCAWDCWAGHWKVKCVPKPHVLSASQVSAKYHRAAMSANGEMKDIQAHEVLAMMR